MRAFAAAAILALTLSGMVWAEPRPVGLAGASYGNHETRSIIRNALTISDDLEYVFENRGDSIPPEEFNKYSLVILSHSVAQPLTAPGDAAVRKYLEDGGHLLLVNNAPNSLGKDLGLENMKWFGPKRVQWQRKAVPCKPLKPDHPFLKGVFGQEQPKWLEAPMLADPAPGFEAVIGDAQGRALVGVRRVGKGWVAFAGHELFRLKPQTNEDAATYITVLRNIVAEAGPLTKTMTRQRALDDSRLAGRPLLLWTREWQRGEEYGPQFDPILPTDEECVSSLSADMAVDEVESLQLNLTPLVDTGLVSWSIESGGFPQDKVEFLVQDRPDPIPWPKDPSIARESPYWMLPPQYVEPKGKPEFSCAKGQTRILWLRINTFGVKPGSHGFTLNLTLAQGPKVSVPVSVKVYPVRIPRRRPISLAAGGQVYGDVDNPAPAMRFTKDLEAHGFEWSLINAIRVASLRIAGTDDKPDTAYFARNAKRFESGDFPSLDCSAWDEWMEQAIGHGLIHFAVADPLAPVVRELQKTSLSPEAKKAAQEWFSREMTRYLREKGVRMSVLRFGDELSEKEIRERYVPWAKPLTEAGWGCSSTFTGAKHLDPQLNAELYPWVKLWTLNRGLAPGFIQKVRAGAIKVRPDAIIGTYGAGEGRGSECRKPLCDSRFLGWESWKLGVQNCFVNPYFKSWLYYTRSETRDLGVAGERWVSYISKDDLSVPLADCPFLDGIRDGMEEGSLAAMLAGSLDRMGADAPAALRQRMERLLGPGSDAILKWREAGEGEMKVWRVEGGKPAYLRAKRELLETLAALGAGGHLKDKASLWWNDAPLVRKGRPVAAIYEAGVSATELAEAMKNAGGMNVPVVARASALDPALETAIIVGAGEQNPLAPSDLGALKPGAYVIREFPAAAGKPRVLLIAGVDEAGTRKGMRMFAKFLWSEDAWFVR